MKKLLCIIIFLVIGHVAFCQINLDSIPPLLKGKLNGDSIRAAYSVSSVHPWIDGMHREYIKNKPEIQIIVFSSNKLEITKQLPSEKLQAIRNFRKDSVFFRTRPDGAQYGDPFVPVFDSSAVFITVNGINPQNAGQFEFRVLKNKKDVLVPWHTIHLFMEPYLFSSNAAMMYPQKVAFLGAFSTGFGNSLTIDIRKKGTQQILCAVSALWISRKPTVLGVFTGNEIGTFLKVFKNQWQRDIFIQRFHWARTTKDSLLSLRKSFDSHENSLIFYLDDKVRSKKIIEYRLVSKNEKTVWKPNDFDFNFIWLKDLSPGAYNLQMRYSIQRQNVSSYKFSIQPAWYQTAIFKIIAAILILSLIGFIILLIRARKQQQKLFKEQLQKQKNEAVLKSIRSQLNPHFIFNALNSIQGLINKNEIEEANQYLSEFSTLLRDTLEGNDQGFISLSKENEILERYLKLEQLRFGFQFSIQVDKAINPYEVEMPTLLLQPAIENAVKHGVSSLYEQGKLDVVYKKSGHDMLSFISDNGHGFIKNKDAGYGLKLTRERILLLNNLLQNTSIDLQINETSKGTIVQFTFKNWLA